MNHSLAKQFIRIGDKPILMHTIERFFQSASNIHILLVLPEKDFSTWKQVCDEYQFPVPVQIVSGGSSRFQSVRNGLNCLAGEGLVAIHDGVRPFVSSQIIEQSFETAAFKGSAVACVPLKDSVREVAGEQNKAIDRTRFRLIQTPQTFKLSLIKQAFETQELASFTDDASVAEHAGFPIHLFDGSYENIKITTLEDLLWAEAFLRK